MAMRHHEQMYMWLLPYLIPEKNSSCIRRLKFTIIGPAEYRVKRHPACMILLVLQLRSP